MDLGLKGMKAAITGGTRGIGRAIAETLAVEGCAVSICARKPDEVDATVRALEAKGSAAFGRALDVTDTATLKTWIDASADALGGLDILVANVSALASSDTPEAWSASYSVDLMATINSVNAALPHIERSKAGAIVAISSVSGSQDNGSVSPYGTMKAALLFYMKTLANQLARKNIRANLVSPGSIYFEDGVWGMAKRHAPERYEHVLKRNPMRRMGTPEEVARVVAFVASPAASFMAGSNVVVDGAITTRIQN